MNYPKFTENEKRDELLSSVKANIRAVLASDSILKHRRDLLDICIWHLTEIDGKYNTRFRSEGAMIDENWCNVQHEHVYQRKTLILRLINGEDIDSVVREAVACLVTKAEHKILSEVSELEKVDGWVRYKLARINVYDLKNKCKYDFT